MPLLRRVAAVIVVAPVLTLSLAACGDGDSEATDRSSGSPSSSAPASTSPTPTGTGLPACADVWTSANDLPDDYRGCDDNGTRVPPETIDCSSGQRIITFDGHFWAVRGHRIGQSEGALLDDPDYQSAIASCRA